MDSGVYGWILFGVALLAVGLMGWRATWLERHASNSVDDDMREAGYAPPETDVERTGMIPAVQVDEDLQHGTHSLRVEAIRVGQVQITRAPSGWLRVERFGVGLPKPRPFQSAHHRATGRVWAMDLLAREAVVSA